MTWHTITQITKDTYRISEPLGVIEPRVGVETANLYLVVGRERAVLIDSGLGIADVREVVREITPLPCMVLNTHYHWDHVGGNALFAESGIHESEVDLVAQEPDISFFRRGMRSAAARAALPPSFDPGAYRVIPKPPTRALHDDELIDLGDRSLRVLHVPGHSPGHVAYLDEAGKMLFTGDTAYLGPVYACFEGGDPAAFARSLKRLAALRDVTTVCPGHNDVITEAGWLGELAECFDAALLGKVPGQVRDNFFVGREFSFGALSVWLPR